MLKTDNEAFNQEFDEIKEQFYKVMQKNLSQGNLKVSRFNSRMAIL